MALKEKDLNSQRLTVTDSESTKKPIKRRPSLKLKKPAGNDGKRRRLSEGASGENHEEAGRFEAVNREMLESLSKPHAPKNTQLNTQWAMNNCTRELLQLRKKAVSTILASGENEERKELQTFSTNLSPSVGLPIIAQSQSMNIQSSVQSTPAIQFYGCLIKIYQGPVDHSEPQKEKSKAQDLL